MAGARAYECVYCHDLDRSHAINDVTKKKSSLGHAQNGFSNMVNLLSICGWGGDERSAKRFECTTKRGSLYMEKERRGEARRGEI